MSFADIASKSTDFPSTQSAAPVSSTMKNVPLLDKLGLKLEQYQRQVGAVRRQAQNAPSTIEAQQDLEDRIKYACMLQDEIAKMLPQLPRTPAMEVSRRKLLKDFERISNQLEAAVQDLANAQMKQSDAMRQEIERGDGSTSLHATINGQVIEFKQLDNEIAHNEALIEERAKDIDRIHQSVAQVNEIFRDLAAIVNEQQGAIDDIGNHVEESLAQTQQGLAEVKKAAANQSSCRIM
ncbi:hypothetical protein LEN26_000067 [Aphanomyces euteiches]|uniref:t-SNARE coiled-coil homology domain-containing protein n=1 Tax=Aphanomyces euteiches TaxID=100861 RepID=A0A6G0XLK2_9STRA|nr:hypothetical protein Ae201684_003531 [Aphanomyces euteiches]KAH9098521.1 hypothetical protein Ae201684P_017733 [Aphanomyces euteiches]KAH9109155.1 hypothetical protein AeMF1_015727 [Aphanomyces euteiches]KAH9145366.1 hypothetical protein AeRB84_010719 [Aphanomyces euteiches]KAH9164432.1 hypothetical protein LEN26_000067 [Aphanomyces euteiches]